MKINIETVLQKLLQDVNLEKAQLGDNIELAKFRRNFSNLYFEIQTTEPDVRKKWVRVIRDSAIKLVEQLPIVTPIVAPFLETFLTEDLGDKIDNLGSKIDELKSIMLEMLTILKERLPIPQK